MQNIKMRMPSLVGGVLLVIGNVVGAGMLALPLAITQLGLLGALVVLIFFWGLTLMGAYYTLEVNLAFTPRANLIAMAKATLGKVGALIAWSSQLCVMYSLIAAYIAGGGDLIKTNFSYLHIAMPFFVAALLFVLLLGGIVGCGIRVADYTNRIFMAVKISLFLALLLGLVHHGNIHFVNSILSNNISKNLFIIVLTSFGFSPLIPSLRYYYKSEVAKIKTVIFWGTFIPLLSYSVWTISILSIIPYRGMYGLQQMQASAHPLSDLQIALHHFLSVSWETQAINGLSAICLITSFLVNAISLTDFIADGCFLYNGNKKSFLVYIIAFLPPFVTVLFFQKAFLLGLSAAGTIAVILILILPGTMVWRIRYVKSRNATKTIFYTKKIILFIFIIVSISILLFTLGYK